MEIFLQNCKTDTWWYLWSLERLLGKGNIVSTVLSREVGASAPQNYEASSSRKAKAQNTTVKISGRTLARAI